VDTDIDLKTNTKNISVLGPGRWGTFIAWYLDKIGNNVMLWGRDDAPGYPELKATRRNEFLQLGDEIVIPGKLGEALAHAEIVIISISSQNLRSFATELATYDLGGKIIVLCMKGMEEDTGKRLTQILSDCLPADQRVAVWVGPGHVQDYISGIPNCMVIDSAFPEVKEMLVPIFTSKLIRFYYGTDLIGNEIGAAAKNVIGIAAGMLDGLGHTSLKGALMARGAGEISRLIKAAGGNPISAFGLAHLGDYEATLFSPHSHNRMFGELLIKKLPYTKLAEGVSTVRALMRLSEKYDLDLPISQTVHAIVHEKKDVHVLFENLFSRSIKNEFA
jgi:glycerol-3-phosphate dehydrogenase (NAD(P)+)